MTRRSTSRGAPLEIESVSSTGAAGPPFAGDEPGDPAAREGVDAGQDLVCASMKAVGGDQPVDAHVGAAMVVVLDPRGQAALGFTPVLEVEALP
jgi:hypothetical protein